MALGGTRGVREVSHIPWEGAGNQVSGVSQPPRTPRWVVGPDVQLLPNPFPAPRPHNLVVDQLSSSPPPHFHPQNPITWGLGPLNPPSKTEEGTQAPSPGLPSQCPPLQVAGTRVPLPLSLAGGRVRLERRGGQRRVATAIGVRVAVGGDGAVTVTAPATLRGQLCGLCAHPEEGAGEGQGTQCCEWGC